MSRDTVRLRGADAVADQTVAGELCLFVQKLMSTHRRG